jgi:hypothetical protein
MAKKKENKPSALDEMLGSIYGNGAETTDTTDVTNMGRQDSVVEVDTKKETPDTEDGDSEDDENKGEFTVGNDDSDVPEHILNNSKNDDDKDNTDINDDIDDSNDSEPSEEEVTEAQQVSALFDAVGESLGWNMTDFNDDDKPVTVDQFTEYLGKVVEQNSVPKYADDRIAKLDEYVKNGGKFEDFYAKQQESLSFENLDLENESNQKSVIRELLKYNGYTDEQINNKISRYEDADMLYDESEDALERLKFIRQQELEDSRKQQEELAKQQEEQSKQFFQNVSQDISSLDSIRGISIPKEDRAALYDYIFKVDQDGISQYQKDFNANLSKNLIESAYFTMKGDALVSGAKRDGETSAAEKLRKLLRHTSKNHTTYNSQQKQKSAAELVSGLF